MEHEATSPRVIKPRRKYSSAFKKRVLAECQHTGESIAGVALRHGLNANLIHKWRQTSRRQGNSDFVRLPAPSETPPSALSAPVSPADTIRLEVTMGQSRVIVDWPLSRLHQSIDWLRAVTQ